MVPAEPPPAESLLRQSPSRSRRHLPRPCPRPRPGCSPPLLDLQVRGRGEIRGATAKASLRRRAWPLALSLLLVSIAGFLAEVAATAQVIELVGPQAMLVVYPLGGLGLIVIAVAQYTLIDGHARLPMIRLVGLIYCGVRGIRGAAPGQHRAGGGRGDPAARGPTQLLAATDDLEPGGGRSTSPRAAESSAGSCPGRMPARCWACCCRWWVHRSWPSLACRCPGCW